MKKFVRINIIPIGKPRMTRADRWKKRLCVLEYWRFKDEINLKRKGFELGNRFSVLFCVPFPKSYSKEKCQMLFLKPHDQKPDVDNMVKAVMDSLHKKDKEVSFVKARKIWGYKPAIFLINRVD